ncbi:MAG: hypothetical protein RL701_3724 [Pseudomonadota bacterium]
MRPTASSPVIQIVAMQVCTARHALTLNCSVYRQHPRRSVSRRLCLASALALAFLACSARPAAAYCRESNESGSQGECVPNPSEPFLFWSRSCGSYIFNNLFFARMTALQEPAIRKIFSDSFGSWAAVDCSGRKPFSMQQDPGTTTVDRAEIVYDAPNQSVINALPESVWPTRKDHDSLAIAVTMIWLDKRNGEILDWDMDLNLGIGTFTDCEKQTCRSGMVDLQNTVTHEAGHALGLGHSTVPDSTMEFQTSRGVAETSKRSLAPDDTQGYCALNLPPYTCVGASCVCAAAPIIPSKRSTTTCACSGVGDAQPMSHGPWASLVLACIAGVRVVQRKRRSRSSPQ